jgi:PPOX class probable F420-dependent enzyme
MNNNKLAPFDDQKYLNLETYRRNGVAVLTPVWFAEKDGLLYVYSLANAGKVKRIRNSPRVRIAPCTATGRLKGHWVEARAWIAGPEETELGHRLLNEKYPLKRIGDWFSRLRKRRQVVIAITLSDECD